MKPTIIATATAASAVAAAALYRLAPWSGALLLAAALLAALAWRLRGNAAKIALANLAAVAFALSIVEAWLGHEAQAGDGTRMEGTVTGDFVQRDDDLGYAPKRGTRVTARKLYDERVLYDVVYTIDDEGLRTVPRPSSGRAADCVHFFGDSISFGEGVQDDQNFPYLYAKAAGDATIVRNHAFSGYGPHQMLAKLQAGRVPHDRRCASNRFVYLAIPEHVARSAGLASWDRHGPRFRLAEGGQVVRDGNFDDLPRVFGHRIPGTVMRPLRRSHAFRRFLGDGRTPDARDLDLYLAVVKASRDAVSKAFPGSAFDVVLWDARSDPRIETIAHGLEASRIRVHRLSEAIPDLLQNHARYEIDAHEPHPNPTWHALTAQGVGRWLRPDGARRVADRGAILGGRR